MNEYARNHYHQEDGKEKAKLYFGDSKESLKIKFPNKYREQPDEKKNLKREYGRNPYKNLS